MKTIQFNKSIQGIGLIADHYKNCVMSIRFFIPLKQRDNTKLSLLSLLIKDRNNKYPSKALMQSFKDNLYGASIISRTFSYGPTHVLEVKLSALSQRFVNEPLQAIQLQGLSDLIYQPMINQETLLEAKQSLLDKINRSTENPMNFAFYDALEQLGKGTTLEINPLGKIEDLDSITVDEMLSFHQELMIKAECQLIIGGNFHESIFDSIGVVFQHHSSLKTTVPHNIFNQVTKPQIIKQKPINQAVVVQLFKTQIGVTNPLFYALSLGNVILGQLPTSHLFQEVREKNSLCYSISSQLIKYEGVLVLNTALAEQNINQAIDLMLTQVERIKQGDFSDQQLEAAKKMMINSLESIVDDESSLINYTFDTLYRQLPLDIQKQQKTVQEISRESIIQAFSGVELLMNYVLKGESHE